MKKSSLLRVFCGAALICGSLSHGIAAAVVTVVDLAPSNDYVNGTVGMNSTVAFNTYSESTYRSPQSNYNTSGNLTNANFYGAALPMLSLGGSGTQSSYNVQQPSGGTDRFNSTQAAPSDGSFAQLSTLFTWKQADFLNGGNAVPVTLDSNSSVVLNGLVGGAGNRVTDVRFVLKHEGSYYISERLATKTGTSLTNSVLTLNSAGASVPVGAAGWSNLTSSPIDALSWFNYDPLTNVATIGSAATLSSLTFDWVGLQLFSTATAANAIANFTFQGFQVNATIPEPGSVALFGLGGIGLMVLYRRRLFRA